MRSDGSKEGEKHRRFSYRVVVGSCGILEWCSGIPTKALEFSSSKLLILKELCCFPEIKRKKTSISKKLKLKY